MQDIGQTGTGRAALATVGACFALTPFLSYDTGMNPLPGGYRLPLRAARRLLYAANCVKRRRMV